jgi:uncharacterized membrane protein
MRKRNMNGSRIFNRYLILIVFLVVPLFASPEAVFGQKRNCGAEGQRPCKIWERIPSCNKGLRENFRIGMCVGPKTQVDARTGEYIPRDTRKMTTVSLCNRSSRPMIYAAIAQWFDHDFGWVSRGWFKIPAGKCDKVEVDLDYTGAVYVYGSAPDGTEWDSTDARFCIKTYDTFDIDNADSLQCPTRDHSIVGMAKIAVKPGNNNFNFGN